MLKLLNKPEPARVVGWGLIWFGSWLLLHFLLLQNPLVS